MKLLVDFIEDNVTPSDFLDVFYEDKEMQATLEEETDIDSYPNCGNLCLFIFEANASKIGSVYDLKNVIKQYLNKKEIAFAYSDKKEMGISIDKYLRTPIKMEQLIQITPSELDMFTLYTDADVKSIDRDTELYIDDPIEIDYGGNELYPTFAKKNGLSYYFNGDIASDIIWNTKHQLGSKTPSIDDYIKNFNYYDKYDCFFDFEEGQNYEI